jgi:osmotically-inducible protein OsmY
MKTDDELRQDVNDELNWEPGVHASEIDVDVKNGAVTLSGTVCSYPERWTAENAALRVHGAKSVESDLRVRLHESHRREDAAIRQVVEEVLGSHSALSDSDISVSVEDGWVILSGNVELQHQRQAADDVAGHLTGVTGLTNDIAVASPVSATAVKSDIELALQRVAATDAQGIHVEVQGTSVKLTGNVRGAAERHSATQSAWATPGVTSVVDQLVEPY